MAQIGAAHEKCLVCIGSARDGDGSCQPLSKHASLIGGKNHFLSFIEAIRLTRPHPLMAKEACFRFDKGNIRWEKVIFKENIFN